MVKGYKVFNADWTCSPDGNAKQYACPGKFEEDVKPIRCGKGMHFCKKAADCFNHYLFTPAKKVAEVIAYGDIAEEGNKCCTNKLEVVREIPWQEVLELVNTGSRNTGIRNTGDRNTGDWNTGDRNTGDWNTGDRNTGIRNTGDWNTGSRNTRNWNTGDWNTGDRNTGNRNTGDGNTGNWNTGDWNAGNWNTGDWNATNFSSGCFNTVEQTILLFNEPSDWTYGDWLDSDARHILNGLRENAIEWVSDSEMTDEEMKANPTHETTGGYLKTLGKPGRAQAWWDNLSEDDRDIIRDIPNFNPGIFNQCTGIKITEMDRTKREEAANERH